MGDDDAKDRRKPRSPVEDWLASQLAAHLGAADPEDDDRGEEIREEPEPEPTVVAPTVVAPTVVAPAPTVVTPTVVARAPVTPPRAVRATPPSAFLRQAVPTSDLDSTDPDLSDPGHRGPTEPEIEDIEDLEVVADFDSQKTAIRNQPLRRPVGPPGLGEAPTVIQRPRPAPTPPPPRSGPAPRAATDGGPDDVHAWTGISLGLLLSGMMLIVAAVVILRYLGLL